MRQTLLLTLVCLLSYAPFSGKAFRMDSPVTIYMTHQMCDNFWNPAIGDFGVIMTTWNHTDLPRNSAFYATPHPPLISAYLVPFVKIGGERELLLNWAMFPFYLLSVLFFFGIAARVLPRWRFEAAVLFAVSPVLLVNAQNVMLDVPLACFAMGSFFFMFRSDSAKDALLAGIFAGLACLTKFSAGPLFITAGIYYLMTRKWRPLLLFMIPFVAINGAWMLHNQILFGKTQLLNNGHMHYYLGDLRYRFERMISSLGGTVVLPVFVLGLALWIKKYRIPAGISVALASGWSFLMWRVLHYSPMASIMYAIFAAAGLVMLYGSITLFVGSGEKRKDVTLAAHTGINVIDGLFLTLYCVRYLLPFVFVPIIFFFKLIDDAPKIMPRRAAIWTCIITTALLSLSLSLADWQIADADKRIAQDIKASYPGKTVHYIGRLGYMYYMDRVGCRNMVFPQDSALPGDIMVQNNMSSEGNDLFARKDLRFLEERRYPVFPLTTRDGKGCFYGGDRLPYWWSGWRHQRGFRIYERLGK